MTLTFSFFLRCGRHFRGGGGGHQPAGGDAGEHSRPCRGGPEDLAVGGALLDEAPGGPQDREAWGREADPGGLLFHQGGGKVAEGTSGAFMINNIGP